MLGRPKSQLFVQLIPRRMRKAYHSADDLDVNKINCQLHILGAIQPSAAFNTKQPSLYRMRSLQLHTLQLALLFHLFLDNIQPAALVYKPASIIGGIQLPGT